VPVAEIKITTDADADFLGSASYDDDDLALFDLKRLLMIFFVINS